MNWMNAAGLLVIAVLMAVIVVWLGVPRFESALIGFVLGFTYSMFFPLWD